MTDLGARLEKVESQSQNYDSYEDGYGYYGEESECFEPDYSEEAQPVGHGSETQKDTRKRPADESSHSKLESMAKKFRSTETVDENIDQTFAEYINDLFHNWIDEDRYEKLINKLAT
ncbi:hypothetical protein DPMN_071057 [Dreissena polymorpha]|uniref:Uncharacterized protein n=1 Tax=Dreissena polymorpha TaxID=45954 RepID=A0A9D3Z273_DREPO|nr:hypothetical protein DPMN_071057 [Dreissena polymorpha]